MTRARLLAMMLLVSGASVARAQGGLLTWNRIDIRAHLDNDGRVEITETAVVSIQGDVAVVSRDFNEGVEQDVVIHGIFRVDSLGAKKPLKVAPVAEADAYEVWSWGLRFSLRGEKDPPFEAGVQTRTYVIEYALSGAITPAWDLAAGRAPLDRGTVPRNPLERAKEVIGGWREAWPDLRKTYRFDHDFVFPSRGTTDSLIELNYHLEYDSAFVLLDKDRELGLAIPEVDYRVQRLLRYLPEGAPREANLQNAAVRVASVFAPLAGGLVAGLLFLLFDRVRNRAPLGDRALFESRIAGLPPESIAATLGQWARPLSFKTLFQRMAAQKKIAITVESEATDEADAKIRMRLMTDRATLSPFEREVVQGVFGTTDTVSTTEIQHRHRESGFNPNLIVSTAMDGTLPKPSLKRRPILAALYMGTIAVGVALMFKSLVDEVLADPAPLFGGLLPGYFLVRLWPSGAPTRRPSALLVLFTMTVFGLLGVALALTPNTPLGAPAAAALALLCFAHCLGYLSGLPRSDASDLEFEAARRFALEELRRPRPALRDAWVESIEALGGRRALARWKKKYGSQAFGGAPDLSEVNLTEAVSGPPFTGEPLPPAPLPPYWETGFFVDSKDDEEDE